MMEMFAHPVTVVANDAGAANHIFAWIGDEQTTMCLTGPARTLWLARLQKTEHRPSFPKTGCLQERVPAQSPLTESDLAVAIAGAATVISGTGWESSLEHDARKLAREQGHPLHRCHRPLDQLRGPICSEWRAGTAGRNLGE